MKPVAILFAVTLCIHAPFLRAGYSTDDFEHFWRVSSVPLTEVLTKPDKFGFFRPLQHSSYWLETRVAPSPRGLWSRLDNLALHLAVIALFFAVARRVLSSSRSAFVAALAFTLAPKTPAIAIMWISARSEILAALFVLLAILAWISWVERGRAVLLALSGLCYVVACLSKEGAILMPLLLFVLPAGPASRRRWHAAALFAVLGAGVIAARTAAGALTPWAPSPYNLMTPGTVWAANALNYTARALPAPALIVAAGVAAGGMTRIGLRGLKPVVMAGAAWWALFILPVLPVALRSEVRLYLPQLGLCLIAGAMVQQARINAALAVCVLLLGGYQVGRAAAAANTLEFSESLVAALRQHPALQDHRGLVLLTPESPEADRQLRDAVGGHIRPLLRLALGRNDIDGTLVDRGDPAAPVTLRLACEVHDGEARLLFRSSSPAR